MGLADRQGRLTASPARSLRRPRRRRLAPVLALLLAGCAPLPPAPPPRVATSTAPPPRTAAQDPFQDPVFGRAPRDPDAPREWISTAAGVIGRENERIDLGGGPALAVDVGLELSPGGGRGLVPSLELGFAASSHAVRDPGFATVDDVGLGRVSFGGRLALAPGRARISPYVRGGVFHRWELSSAREPDSLPDQDQSGTYWGGGLDFARVRQPSWGVFVVVYEGEDDGLRETFVGFNATVWY